MRHEKLKLSSLLLLGLSLIGLQAQEVVPASGGEASGSGGSVSYSVGQLVYTTNTGTNGTVAQGIQQPYEISVVSGLKEAIGISLMFSAYPNPTSDILILKVDTETDIRFKSLSYQLFDLSGKLLVNNKIESDLTSIPMGNLISATYFLKVIQSKDSATEEVKTFKIIKQ